jgi:hypothetical protein
LMMVSQPAKLFSPSLQVIGVVLAGVQPPRHVVQAS